MSKNLFFITILIRTLYDQFLQSYAISIINNDSA